MKVTDEGRKVVQQLMDEGVDRRITHQALEELMNCGLINSKWRHFRNREIYTVVGFQWNCETDRWCVVYKRDDLIFQFTRSFPNWMGYGSGITRRFEQVTSAA